MHLSLELPEGVDEAVRLDTQSLLQDHLQVGCLGAAYNVSCYIATFSGCVCTS